MANVGKSLADELARAQIALDFAGNASAIEAENRVLDIRNDLQRVGLELTSEQERKYRSVIAAIQATEQATLDVAAATRVQAEELEKVEQAQQRVRDVFGDIQSLASDALRFAISVDFDQQALTEGLLGFFQSDQFKSVSGDAGAAIGALFGLDPKTGEFLGEAFAEIVGIFAADAAEANARYVAAVNQAADALGAGLATTAKVIDDANAAIAEIEFASEFGSGIRGEFAKRQQEIDAALASDLAALTQANDASVRAAKDQANTFFGAVGNFFTGLFGGVSNVTVAQRKAANRQRQLLEAQARAREAAAKAEAALLLDLRRKFNQQVRDDILELTNPVAAEFVDLQREFAAAIDDAQFLGANASALKKQFNLAVADQLENLDLAELEKLNAFVATGGLPEFAAQIQAATSAAQAQAQAAQAAAAAQEEAARKLAAIDFNQSVNDDILKLTNNPAFQVQALQREQEARLAEGIEIGISTADRRQLDRLFALQLRELLEGFETAQIATLRGVADSAVVDAILAERAATEALAAQQEAAAQAAQAYATIQADLTRTIERQISDLSGLAKSYSDASAGLAEFRRSLDFGEFSTLTGAQQVQESRNDLSALFNRASGGDLDALASFERQAEQLLQLSRGEFASSGTFQRDLELVKTLTERLAQSSAGQAQLFENEVAALSAIVQAENVGNDRLAQLVENTEQLIAVAAGGGLNGIVPLPNVSPQAAVGGAVNVQAGATNVNVSATTDLGDLPDEVATLRAQNEQIISLLSRIVESSGELNERDATDALQGRPRIAVGA